MARASTYNWSRQSAIDQGRLSWSDCDAIRERSPTHVGHPTKSSTQQSQSQISNHDKKEKYCCDWNYIAKWDCHTTSASYSSNHRCRMCDMMDHPMLHCPKRKFPIPSTPTNQDSTKEWQLNILSCSCWLHESSSPVQFSGSKTHFDDSI